MPIEEEEKPTPAEVRSRLRVIEDHNLALRLQEEEFHHHYDQNRTERRTVGMDTKTSKTEQEKEDYVAREMRRNANRRIEESDEEMARRIANEFEKEERKIRERKEFQLRQDEEIARRMAEGVTSPVQATDFINTSDSQNAMQIQPQIAHNYSNIITNDSTSNVPPPPNSMRGIPLPGLSEPIRRSSTPSVHFEPPTNPPEAMPQPPLNRPDLTNASQQPLPITNRLRSESLDSPVNWPAPPSSLRTETTFPVEPGWSTSNQPVHQVPETQPIGWVSSNLPLNSTNPFLNDLQSLHATNVSNTMFSVQPMPEPIQSASISNNNIMDSQIGAPPPYEDRQGTTSGVLQPTPYQSEFGLPPPSSLALGQSSSTSGRQF